MRKLLVALIIVASIAWSVFQFVADEGVRFYAEDHRRIVLLFCIAAIGMAGAVAYQALSVARKRNVALWFMGSLATGATASAVYMVYLLGALLRLVDTAGALRDFLGVTNNFLMLLAGVLLPGGISCGILVGVLQSSIWVANMRVKASHNKAGAGNGATALSLHVERRGRAVPDLRLGGDT